MDDKPKRGQCVAWLAVGMMLMIGYPFTAPIANRLVREGYLPNSANVFFDPLAAAMRRLPNGARETYSGYWSWWNPSPQKVVRIRRLGHP